MKNKWSIAAAILTAILLFTTAGCKFQPKDEPKKDEAKKEEKDSKSGSGGNTVPADFFITFDPNIDEENLLGKMEKQGFYAGKEQNIRTNEFEYFGIFFDKWTTNADGTGDSYTDKQSIILTSDITLYAQWKDYKILPAETTGTMGANKRYVLFGYWPQTIKAENITIDEKVTKEGGMFTYYKGSDGKWYVKQAEMATEDSYTYSNGSPVGQSGEEKYFLVEPIKWCELTDSFAYKSGKNASFLLSENVLTANCFYENHLSARKIGTDDINPSNYKESQIRAFLNGYQYTSGTSTDSYTVKIYNDGTTGKGFLQQAFTQSAQDKIVVTTVKNDSASSVDTVRNCTAVPENLICEDTNDKIFLISKQEITVENYGFSKYPGDNDSARKKYTTDFSKAKGGGCDYNNNGSWWLRTPSYESGNNACYVSNLGSAYDYKRFTSVMFGVVPALCINLQ